MFKLGLKIPDTVQVCDQQGALSSKFYAYVDSRRRLKLNNKYRQLIEILKKGRTVSIEMIFNMNHV